MRFLTISWNDFLTFILIRLVYVDISTYAGIGAGESPTSTILVSGLLSNVSVKELTKYFSKFGTVLEVVRPKDAEEARWAFIHFKDCASVEQALSERHVVGDQLVDCRRAYDYRREGKALEEVQKKPNEAAKKPAAKKIGKPAAVPVKAAVAKQNEKPAHVPKNIEKPAHVPVPAPEPARKSEQSVVAEKDIADVTKFLISHLTANTTTEMLKKHFSKYGTVLDAYIPTVYGTGASKGFGYIVVPSKDLRLLNQKHMIDGVGVIISVEGVAASSLKTNTLLVSAGPQIMKVITENDLNKFFSRFGKISSVRKFSDPLTKEPSHYAFVEYISIASAEKALKNMAYIIKGHVVCVTKSRHEPHNK